MNQPFGIVVDFLFFLVNFWCFFFPQEQDQRLLEAMIEKEREEISINTARREKARADAQWMKQVELLPQSSGFIQRGAGRILF